MTRDSERASPVKTANYTRANRLLSRRASSGIIAPSGCYSTVCGTLVYNGT